MSKFRRYSDSTPLDVTALGDRKATPEEIENGRCWAVIYAVYSGDPQALWDADTHYDDCVKNADNPHYGMAFIPVQSVRRQHE